MTAASDLLSRFSGCTIIVIGDLMIDHFVVGGVDRISPEAPVPVVRFEEETWRLGGAANVAHNVAALGARVLVIGLTGTDEAAAILRSGLEQLGIATAGLVDDNGRRTTRKLRLVTTRNQQVARIDYEDDREVQGEAEAALVSRIDALLPSANAVLISDYLKGVVSAGVARAAIGAANRRQIPVLIDPKVPHIDYYSGASVITPNHHEAEAVAHMRIRTGDDALTAAQRFRQRANCESVLITRGEHGMTLLGPTERAQLAAEAREVADVTGAGDTVIATMTLALAAGASLTDAAQLANRAAGVVVGKFGPATVSVEELRDS